MAAASTCNGSFESEPGWTTESEVTLIYFWESGLRMNDRWERRRLRKSRQDFRRNKELLTALHRETDYQRADVAARTGKISTKASILIASASISSALQYDAQGFWFLAAVWLSVVAAVLGALVLLPRVGSHLAVEAYEQELWGEEPSEVHRDLMYQKLRILRQDEKALLWRRKILLVGYAALAVSLLSAAIHLSTTTTGEDSRVPEEVTSTTTAA